MVARYCADWGIPHQVLVWDHGGDVRGNLMQAARQARYGLIADWALRQGVEQVMLGHTADDQAEGFLMALSRGAGLDGLSGMAGMRIRGGIRFCRPLLSVRRQALRDHLDAHRIVWAEDPTNSDERYQRTRLRKALTVLAPLGIDTEQVQTSIAHLAASRAALAETLADWAVQHVTTDHGMVQIDRAAFAVLQPELRRRLLLAALGWLSRADHPPRGTDQLRFLDSLLQGRGATLAGCRARVLPRHIRLTREARAVCDGGPLWDRRWHVTPEPPEGAEIRALGGAGLALCSDWRKSGIPREALIVSPAIWRGDCLLAAPLLQPDGPWHAGTGIEFRFFILSH